MGKLVLGSAPDSWGVWFARDEHQLTFTQFLDELAGAGYKWLELGPYGYLPTEPRALAEQLGSRGLRVSGGTAGGALHRSDRWDDTQQQARQVGQLTAAAGAQHVIFLPSMYRDESGKYSDDPHLSPDGWHCLTDRADELGKMLLQEFGVHLCLHPHADSHIQTQDEIERFLDATDSRYTNLCLDTGHVAYGGGDSIDLIRRYTERIAYVHMKHIDPIVLAHVRDEDLSFSQAVRRGLCVEPSLGVPDARAVVDALGALRNPLYVIAEHDLYPCAPDVPLPIAVRTRAYLSACVTKAGSPRPSKGDAHHEMHP